MGSAPGDEVPVVARRVPDRDLVAPPQLSRHAPVVDAVQPVVPDLVKPESSPKVRREKSVDRIRGCCEGVHEILGKQGTKEMEPGISQKSEQDSGSCLRLNGDSQLFHTQNKRKQTRPYFLGQFKSNGHNDVE